MDDLGIMQLGVVVLTAFFAGFLLMLSVLRLLQGSRVSVQERLMSPKESQGTSVFTPFQVMRDRRMSNFNKLNSLLRISPLAESIALELAQAHVPLKVGEYLLVRVLSALVAAYVLMNLGGSWLAVVPGMTIGYFAPKVYVSHRKGRRMRTLELQLVDALALSANSLRAGWGFMQAMSQVAAEMPEPISEEFTQVLQEVNLGTSPEVAVQHLLDRVPSYDLELVMTAVLIQRQVGGNLAEMMDSIGFTIRERTRLLRDISSITAESRLSMWLLCLLPVGLLIFMAVIQPDYMLPFLTDTRGRFMLVGAGVMELAGVVIMQRLAQIQV